MEKKEVLLETLKFLKDNPFTSMFSLFNYFKELLKKRGEIGAISTGTAMCKTTRFVDMSKTDQQLINEVVWDLIIERILTPGGDYGIYIIPNLYVTDENKLDLKLASMN